MRAYFIFKCRPGLMYVLSMIKKLNIKIIWFKFNSIFIFNMQYYNRTRSEISIRGPCTYLPFDFFDMVLSVKHRHQRCKAPSICKTFFITNIFRLKEAGQKKYVLQLLSYNVTSFSQRHSHYVSHNIFLTSFSQRLSHNIFLTGLFSHRCPYIIIHTT